LKDVNGQWNYLGYRGRCFHHLDEYDPFIKECMQRIKETVEVLDLSLVWAPFTHRLTLYYPVKRGIGWHVDGDQGAPVYSLTLGNSCIN
jgi:alkylated DNA repair dioxygenase AlkB